MATLKDLEFSIMDMGNDEAIEALRQIRLRRRTNTETRKAAKVSTPKAKKHTLSFEQAKQLLNILQENSND